MQATAEDPLLELIGIGNAGPGDTAQRHDEALAELTAPRPELSHSHSDGIDGSQLRALAGAVSGAASRPPCRRSTLAERSA